MNSTFYFQAAPFRLLGRSWTPTLTPFRGTVLCVHGYSEHSGCYDHFAQFLNQSLYEVIAMDLPGHGLSDGRRLNIDCFSDYLQCLHQLMTVARQRSLPQPWYLFGHSLGGLIAIRYIQQFSPLLIKGLILSSPLLGIFQFPSWKKYFLNVLCRLLPNLTFQNQSELRREILTHDENMIVKRHSDPLIHKQVTIHWLRESLKAISTAFQNVEKINIPTAIFQAGDDRVVSQKETEKFFYHLPSNSKVLKIYPTLYHEILNERERLQVMQDIVQYLTTLP